MVVVVGGWDDVVVVGGWDDVVVVGGGWDDEVSRGGSFRPAPIVIILPFVFSEMESTCTLAIANEYCVLQQVSLKCFCTLILTLLCLPVMFTCYVYTLIVMLCLHC